MRSSFHTAALSVLASIALCACGEKPPRADPERKTATSINEQPQNPLQHRAQTQGESERIGN